MNQRYWMQFGLGVLAATGFAFVVSAFMDARGPARRDIHKVIDYLIPLSPSPDHNAPVHPVSPSKVVRAQNAGAN